MRLINVKQKKNPRVVHKLRQTISKYIVCFDQTLYSIGLRLLVFIVRARQEQTVQQLCLYKTHEIVAFKVYFLSLILLLPKR